MGKFDTKYNKEWEKENKWLMPGNNSFEAKCSLCNKYFKINGGGIAQIRAHAQGKKHMQVENTLSGGTSQTYLKKNEDAGSFQLSTGI